MNDQQRISILARAIAKVVDGLESGHIKSPPLLDTSDPEAENYEMISMKKYLTDRLSECGITLGFSPPVKGTN